MLKVFVTGLATKKKLFPPKKEHGLYAHCWSCLEPWAIPAFILSANWVSCWFCEVFVCRQPENDPNKIIVSRERVCGSLYYATGKYILTQNHPPGFSSYSSWCPCRVQHTWEYTAYSTYSALVPESALFNFFNPSLLFSFGWFECSLTKFWRWSVPSHNNQ